MGSGRTAGAETPPRAELPAVFGRYLLLKRLSRGGMGEIFLAKLGEIEGFEKLVIIKKVLPNLVENQDFIARFIDEAQVAIKLNHANIAAVYEVGRTNGEYFLAIEYVEGRDLRRVMQVCRGRGQRLPLDLSLYVVRELLSGLAYAHRRTDARGNPLSVVHCDISPPNVMISFEGEVKIIDFGIARSALRTAGSNPNMGFGKFGYMAPEQILRGGIIDRRTDIYAAGVVLYELLVGERLYQFPEGADYRQIARTVCQGRFLPPSQRNACVPPDLDGLVCRALATQKEDRYQTAEEFRDALQQKLYAMNPTISADSLGRLMTELFAAEWEREREELAEIRAVDVGAYQEELAGSATHTVTYARAALAPLSAPRREPKHRLSAPAAPTEMEGRACPPQPPSALVPQDTALSRLLGFRRARTHVVAAGAAVPLLCGITLAALVHRRGVESQPPVPPPPPAVRPPAPVAEALPVAPLPAPLGEPDPGSSAVRRPVAPRSRSIPPSPSASPKTTGDLPRPGLTPQSVEARFQQVRAEYYDFKRHFGARLEDRWQQILQEAALGKRDHLLDEMLSQLRKEMARIRSGQ